MIHKKINILVAAGLLFACNYSHADIKKSLTGFQDIPWGTKLSTIKNKFPKLAIEDLCKDWPDGRKLAQKENSSCRRLIDENYTIETTKLNLTFKFDFEEKLKSVQLEYKPDKVESSPKVERLCGEVFDRLHYIISSKYGESGGVSNPSPVFPYNNSEYKAWTLAPSVIWIAKSYGTELTSYSKCSVQINYLPQLPADANKL
jgi:hypothetical protein